MPKILSFRPNKRKEQDSLLSTVWYAVSSLNRTSRFALLSLLLLALALPIANRIQLEIRQQAAGTASPTDWPQLQYNAQHTGRTTVQVNPNYSAKWIWMDKNHIVKNFVSTSGKSITDGFESGFKSTVIFSGLMQPITANGKTFFGSVNGRFYAVNALTGDNAWDVPIGGAVLATAADDSGIVIVPSMDGKLYAFNDADGTSKWTFATGAGISAAPLIMNGTVYVGSRDGSFYAVDVMTGTQKWKYDVRDPQGTFNKAAIVAPAAVSEDGATVLFGAENMYFYALNTSNGTEKWISPKLVGQSFLYGWPVVSGSKVIVRTMSSLGGAEWLMESVLDGLSAEPSWTEEKTAILSWLNQNPHQKSMYVLDIATGTEPFQVAMGRVSANNMTSFPPVVDNQNRVLTYWRTKRAYFLQDGATFGTNHCPDISGMDMNTGDRIRLLSSLGSNGFCPEIDNGFQLSVGGSWLYLSNGFRGTHALNLSTGQHIPMSTTWAKYDGGDFRGWGFQIIYYGNDSEPSNTTTDPRPPQVFANPEGFSSLSIASTNSIPMLYVNNTAANAIVGIGGQ